MSGIDRDIVVDPNGVAREASESPRQAQLRTSGPLRLVYVGGHLRHKGLHVLGQALRELSERGVRYEADIYGVDPFAYDVALFLRGTAARAHKPFAHEDLDSIMADHDVLVLPSVMFESSSLVIREALVRRLPVVATESGGPQAVVKDGVNGLLVPPADAGALASAIARLDEDRQLLIRLSQGGLLGPIPTPEEQAEHLERLYRGIEETPPAVSSQAPPRVRQVLFVAGLEGQPLHYRVHQKMEQLEVLGVESRLRRYSDPRLPSDLEAADALVVYRCPTTRELVHLIREAHRRRLPVLFDVDDLIFDPRLAESLPTIAHLPADERALWIDGTHRYRAVMLECGQGIASTPEIKRQMEALGVPAWVHPNGVDTPLAVVSERARRARGSRVRRPGEEFVIGYASGTDTHDADLAHVTDALLDFLRAHAEARLVLCGPLKPLPELLKLGDRVTRLQFVSWDRHPDRLASFDLNLAPLIQGVFNESKSSIKWAEAALVDVPTLASASEPFRESIDDGRTGLLARDHKEWREKLEEAIADRDRLAAIGRAARFAAYRQGSPWVLGKDLLEIVSRSRTGASATRPATDPDSHPDERILSSLEPPGLLPGLRAPGPGSAKAPGETLHDHRVAFDLPLGAGPLRRADVMVVTWTQTPDAPLTLTVRRPGEGELARAQVDPDEIGDNGWVAFEFDRPVAMTRGLRAEMTSAGQVPIAPYVVFSGQRFVNGRARAGAVWARTFHELPVPPDFPAEESGPRPRRNAEMPSRLSGLLGFGALIMRSAISILRTEGPLKGGRRIAGAIKRRSGIRGLLGR
jgi:glycosyltransferase involved in cell wall biosynthesis